MLPVTDPITGWFIALGALLILMTLGNTLIARLPLSSAMIYLLAGWLAGPAGLGLLQLHPLRDAEVLERLTEVAVLISLFSAGFKIDLQARPRTWIVPVRLAFLSMLITVALLAAAGVWLLQLPLGAAVLLGAILAPTDPVLASDVQVAHPEDRDPLRLALTAEGGLNDGTAFPLVMLGLGLLSLHELGPVGLRWLWLDVVWAIGAGLLLGYALGWCTGRALIWLTRRYTVSVGTDEFTALGLIALAYGLALLCKSYGFLAVFAAGLALGRLLRQCPPAGEENCPSPSSSMDSLNSQLERLAEVAIVLVLGAMLVFIPLHWGALPLVLFLLLLVRPLAVAAAVYDQNLTSRRRLLLSWFGIRGIGSLYYLSYAINHGLPLPLAQQLLSLTVAIVVSSVVLHGISVTPLMTWYERRRPR